MNRFQGKVVLVTGGNRNTGLAIVQKFVEEGAQVFMYLWTADLDGHHSSNRLLKS